MTAAMDRRRAPRKRVTYHLRALDSDTKETQGRVADITNEGIMLIGETAFEPGREYSLRIELPEEINGITAIDCKVMCMWCKKDADPGFYSAGFSVTVIEDKYIRAIETLINFLGFRY